MDIPHSVYPLIHGWTFGLFWRLLLLWGYRPRSGIVGPFGNHV